MCEYPLVSEPTYIYRSFIIYEHNQEIMMTTTVSAQLESFQPEVRFLQWILETAEALFSQNIRVT
jgi:hypothetical protein